MKCAFDPPMVSCPLDTTSVGCLNSISSNASNKFKHNEINECVLNIYILYYTNQIIDRVVPKYNIITYLPQSQASILTKTTCFGNNQ